MKIDSFQNSKLIIFSKEISKNLIPDSIETFTPTKKEYYKLLNKVERKSFKSWNRFNKWFYQNDEIKTTKDTLFVKIEGEWMPVNYYEKIIGNPNVYVQIWGADHKGRKLLIYRIYDFRDGKNIKYISDLENKIVEGDHGWFESNIRNITYDLKRKKALNSLEFNE